MKRILVSLAAAVGLTWTAAAAAPAEARSTAISIVTAHTALELSVGPDGRLLQRYYGARDRAGDLPPAKPERAQEFYPGASNGFEGEPAVQVAHEDGNVSTDLVFVSTRTTAPASGVRLTEVRLRDRFYPFFVTLSFRAYEAEDVIEAWTEISHEEKRPLTLFRYASSSPRVQAGAYWLSHFDGDILREGELVEERLGPGMKVLDSKLTVRAHRYRNPSFLISLDGPAREERGEVIGGTLAWSGNFQFTFEVDPRDDLRMLAGINPFGAAYRLAPHRTFTTPAMLWTWSGAGKGEVSRNFHRWARRYGLRDGATPRSVLLNNWETTFFDFDEARLVRLLDAGKMLGVDLFLLDDGWFSDKDPHNNERVGQGDWIVNRKILPHGLSYLAEQAKARGLGFGIWVEPESLHLGSETYRQHPDWLLGQPHRELIAPGHQALLDLTRPAARDFMWSVIDRVLGESPGISYLKWDSNRMAPQPGSSYLPAEEQQNVPVDYQWSLYEVMRRMAEKYPTVTAMLCSAGGARVDYGALRYFHSFWPSDGTDPVERVYIQWGYSHVFPPMALCAHVTNMGLRPLKFGIDVAMSAALGIDRDVEHLSEADRAFLRAGVSLYRNSIRDLVTRGDLYRLESPYEGRRAALSFVLPDRSKAVAFVYQMAEASPTAVHLAGLDPARRYRVREVNLAAGIASKLALDGQTVSGATLMTTGLLPPTRHAIESAVIELTAEP